MEIELATGKKIMGSLHNFYSLGGLPGAGTGALAAWLDINLEWHFTTLAVLGFGIVTWAATGLIEDRTREGTARESGGFVIPPRILWPLGIIAFCSALGEGAMADWSALYLHEHLGSREPVAAIGFFVFSLTMLTGRFLGDGIVATFGPVAVIRTCAIVATAELLFGIAVDEIWSVLIRFGAVGFGLSIVIPLVYGAAGNTPHLPSGRGVASVATIGYTGFLTGPAALGWIAEATSLRFAMLIVVMLSGVVILMADQADPRRRVPAG